MRPLGDLIGIVRKVRVPGPDPIVICCPKCGHTFEAVKGGPVRIHVVLNYHTTGIPMECFLYNLPRGSRAIGNALARCVSLALQHGITAFEVAKALRGQHEGHAPVSWPGGGFVVSVSDALGRLLEEPTKPGEEP